MSRAPLPALVAGAVFAALGAAAALLAVRPPELPVSATSVAAVSPTPVAEPAPRRRDADEPPPAPPEPPPSAPETCPRDMVLVEGWRCPFVAHRCAERRANAPGEEPTCLRYRPEFLCEGAYQRMRFCVDPYEYPNQPGMLPAVLVDFDEARRACDLEGKRLCTAAEWSFTCEGPAPAPYPTGAERDASACRLDAGPEARVVPSRGANVAASLARVDQRVPAGVLARCQSVFGVRDLGGNVAEWVAEPTGSAKRPPFASVIAGGAWGPGPATCRTIDAEHAPNHRAATLGFRCCADAAPRVEGAQFPEPPRRRAGFQALSPRGLP